MKQTILFFLMCTGISFAQATDFAFSNGEFTDFVVVPCENKSQNELYKKTLDWIAVTYNTPSAVLKGQIENEYIRIEGSAKHVIGSGMKYQIELSFKDGRYKFDITEIQFWNEAENIVFGGTEPNWKKFEIGNASKYFDKNGEIKKRFKPECKRIADYFNNLNMSLKEFIVSAQIPSKKNDW